MSHVYEIPDDDLIAFLRRHTNGSVADLETYARYRGVSVTFDNARNAWLEQDARHLVVLGTSGRGWDVKLAEAIDQAVVTLQNGGGEPVPRRLGHLFREDLARREATGAARPVAERTHWMEWLEADELPYAFGAWLHRVRIIGVHRNIHRNATLGFELTNEEFDFGVGVCSPDALFVTLHRLAVSRGAPLPPQKAVEAEAEAAVAHGE